MRVRVAARAIPHSSMLNRRQQRIRHTDVVGGCQSDLIQELVAGFDGYWYITVLYAIMDPEELQRDWDNQRARVERRLGHLSSRVEILRALGDEVTCPACLAEIGKEIGRQTKDIHDIKQKWGL